MSLSDIVSVTITAQTTSPSRKGFGTPLIAGYHTRYLDRVRSYSELSELEDDGFATSDPVYLSAAKILSQNPRPPTFKVGRRALPASQSVRLTPTVTTAGTVYTITIAGQEVTYTVPAGATVASICTALTPLINALTGLFTASDDTTHVTVAADTAADADAIVVTGASAVGAQVYSGATLDGVIGDGDIVPGQKVTLTFSSHADWDATSATLAGFDHQGNAATEALAIPNGGNAAVTSTKRWSRITSISIPAQSGAGGTFTAGIAAPAGSLFDFSAVCASLELHDRTADPGIATDLSAIETADADWYGLCLDSNSEAEINAAAAWVETRRIIFSAHTADTRVKVQAETTDVASDLKGNDYARTFLLWNNALLGQAGAAWLGRMLPYDPGSATWAFKELKGVVADKLTTSEQSALEGKNCNHYQTIAALPITRKGITAGGDWIDITQGIDFIYARMQENVFALLASLPKVPFTDAGVDTVKGVVAGVLQKAVRQAILAAEPAPTVTAPKVADVDVADKAARQLPDVVFQGTLAGAVHKVVMRGVLAL